jgi:hypothetical protein
MSEFLRIETGGILSEDDGQQPYRKKHRSAPSGWDITGW